MAEIVSFGEWLQGRRKRVDMTRKTLASRVGCSAVMIQKIERDERRPSLQIAQLLALHLQIPESEKADFVRHARGEYVRQRAAPQAMPVAATNPAKAHHQLPQQLTPFVGRASELTALEALLTQADVRLITIVGTGGMGKTRLALELAQRLLNLDYFADGVFFVSLAELDHPEQIVSALAEALHFHLDHSDKQRRTIKQQVLDYLRQKRLLIILDNFEHLLDGATVVAEILRESGNVQIVVTSRELLQLQGEQHYPIHGLNFPDAAVEDVSRYSAVDLFCQTARRHQPDFALSAENFTHLNRLCQLVGGMPLGIELAAGWIDTLPLVEIVAEIEKSGEFLETQLRNIPERHRSMRVVFEATWQRLTPDEQANFSQLSVFRGGFTRNAAQSITDVSLQMLGRLVAKSMLQYDRQRGRYLIHELLRQFGLQRLQDLAIFERHAVYFCQTLANHLPHLLGSEPKATLAALEADDGNIMSAWDWVLEKNRTDILATVALALGHYYVLHRHYEAGENAFNNACQVLPNDPTCLIWHGLFLNILGELAAAVSKLKLALVMLDSCLLSAAERLEKGRGLHELGKIQLSQGEVEQSRLSLEEGLAIFKAEGDTLSTANLLISLGNTVSQESDDVKALACFKEALRNYQSLGFERGIAMAMSRMGYIAQHNGDVESRRLALESLAIYERLGDQNDIARGQAALALNYHYYDGDHQKAERLLLSAQSILTKLGDRRLLVQTEIRLGVMQSCLGKYEVSRQTFSSALSQARATSMAHNVALALMMLGGINIMEDIFAAAKEQLLECHAILQQKPEPFYLGRCCAALALLYKEINDVNQSQSYAYRALRVAYDAHDSIGLMWALGASALLLLEQGCDEQAVALHRLNLRVMPMFRASLGIEAKMRAPFMVVEKSLAPEVLSDILKQSEEVGYWDSAETLLTELVALGWDNAEVLCKAT